MTTTRRSSTIFILAVLLLLSPACVSNSPTPKPPVTPTAGQTIPQTSLQWTIIYNAALAKANRLVQQSVATVQKSGAITVAQARPIILACGRVATASEAIRGVTSKGTEATWNVDGPTIRSILSSANLHLSPTGSATVDLGVSLLNSALVLLTQEVSK